MFSQAKEMLKLLIKQFENVVSCDIMTVYDTKLNTIGFAIPKGEMIMKLIKVEKYDLPKYAHMLPESVLHHCKDIFACVDGDTINGIVALEKLDGYMSIALIWVEEDMRRKGIGTALIKCACYCAKEQGSPAVTIVYDPEETYSSVLEYILAKIGFNLMMYQSESYRITDEDIKSSPLMRGVDLDK